MSWFAYLTNDILQGREIPIAAVRPNVVHVFLDESLVRVEVEGYV